MPSGLVHIEHVFGGGWAPDMGAMAVVSVEKDGRCVIPWLMDAENLLFGMDGSLLKVGGTGLLYDGALEAGADVRGLFDFWRQGTAGSPMQTRVMHIGTKVKADDGDAVFADIFVGLQNDSIPHYSAFEGQLIIAQTGNDMPMYTDGVTYTTFASPTPNFAFSEPHKLRMWAAGVDAAPSHLFYSEYEDPTDWTGAGSGEIAISPGDGDRIMAIASHRGELFVFKGPYRGSIHRISGSAPVGDADPFAVNEFIPSGLGAVGQRSIFRFGNDLGFVWSDGSVHSLNTTEKYGDFLESALSRPLNSWLRHHVSGEQLGWASSVTYDPLGIVWIALPADSSATNSTVISMDFRFDPPRWSRIPMLESHCQCLALVVDPEMGNVPSIMSGSTDSRVRRCNFIMRWEDQALFGYTMDARTPFLSYSQAAKRSTLCFVGIRMNPKNAQSFGARLRWTRDGHDSQVAEEIRQWTGDVLAPAMAPAAAFTLGTSQLGGARTETVHFDLPEGGEFQQIQYRFGSTGTTACDAHIKSILSSIKPGAFSTERTS